MTPPVTFKPMSIRSLSKPKKRNKYGAIATEVDGFRFPSKKEAARYCFLKLRRKIGEIEYLELQPEYLIEINGIAVCKARMDFRYYDKIARRIRVEDVKGKDTPVSRIKRKLMLAIHGVVVELV